MAFVLVGTPDPSVIVSVGAGGFGEMAEGVGESVSVTHGELAWIHSLLATELRLSSVSAVPESS
jgi:hypothetical protein